MSEHHHSPATTSKNLIWSITINIIIVVVEVVFGIIARSMALISEALHNFTDIGSMVLSLWGEKLVKKPRTENKTYGYKRAEVIIAFINGGVLLGISGWILIESVIRIFHPQPVIGSIMFVVAVISLLGNTLASYLLHVGAHQNLNLKSAWLHSKQDALFSLGVVAAAIIIHYTGWNWVDPLASIAVSVFLLKEVYEILFESTNMLLDAVPENLDFQKIKNSLVAFPEIKNVNDLHVWQTSSNDYFLSAHVVTQEINSDQRAKLLKKIQEMLKEKYNIHHQTLQIVSQKESEEAELECEHCN